MKIRLTRKKRFLIYLTIIAIAIFFLLHPLKIFGANVTWNGAGTDGLCGGAGTANNWSCASNWAGGAAPTSSDVAIFDSTSSKDATINSSITVLGIDIRIGYKGTITQAASQTVTITTSGFTQADGTFTGGDSLIDINNGSFSLTKLGTFTNSSGGLKIELSFTWRGGGNFINSGKTVTFDDGGNTSRASTITCVDPIDGTVVIGKSDANLSGNSVTIAGGCAINLGDSPTSTTARGSLVNNGTITVNSGTWTTVVTINGGGTFTNNGTVIHNGNGWLLQGGIVNNPGATVTYAGTAMTVYGNFQAYGTFDLSAVTVTFGDGNGQNFGTIDCNGTFPAAGVVFTKDDTISGTVTIAKNCTLNLGDSPSSTLTRTNITINGGLIVNSGTWAITAANNGIPATITVNAGGIITHNGDGWTLKDGNLIMNAGSTVNYAGSSISIDLNLTNSGTTNFSGKTITLGSIAGDASSTVTCATPIAASLTVNKVTPRTVGFASNCTIQGDFTRTAGVVSNPGSAFTVTVQGNLSVSSTDAFGGANLTMTMGGSGTQTITHNAGTISSPFQVDKSGGTATLLTNFTITTAACDVVEGTFALGGKNFTCGSTFTVQDGGNFQLFGAETTTAPTLNSGSTVTYTGDSGSDVDAYTIKDYTYYNLTIASVDSGDTFATPNSTEDADNNFTLSGGVFTAPSSNFTVANNFAHSGGTFTHNSGTVTLDGTNQTISGSSTFYNLTKSITSAATLTFAASSTQTIANTVTLTGTAGSLLSLKSGTSGTRWLIDPQSTRTLRYLSVKDSQNINATAIATANLNISNAGNNIGWLFSDKVGGSGANAGALAIWRFDEGQGASAYNSGYTSGLTGTVSGASWTGNGKLQKALDFDGSDDVVTLTNASAIDLNEGLSNQFTIGAWVWADSDGEADTGQIFQKGTNTYLRVSGQSGSNLDIDAKLDLGTTDATVTVSAPIKTGAWNFIALSYTDDSDDEITVWVNGQSRGTSTNGVGSLAAESSDLLIGGTTTANFDGKIDEFQIYNFELSAAQMAIVKNQGMANVLGSADRSYLMNAVSGWWKMDETAANSCSGGVNDSCDSSGNANDGAWNGNATTTTAGKFGSGTTFDGTTDYVSVADSASVSPTGNLTISAWVNPTTSIATKAIVVKDASYRMVTDGSGNAICQIHNGTSWQTAATSSTALVTSAWQFVTCTYDKTNVRVFVNGDLTGTTAVTTAVADNANALEFGRDNGGTYGDYNGKMDEVRLYYRALSPREVLDLYDWGPPPVSHWNLDEKTGTSAYDIGELEATGTLGVGNSTPSWVLGKYGSALDFDGVDDYVGITDNNNYDFGSGDFAISSWFYRDTSGTTDQIFCQENGSSLRQIAFYVDSSNPLTIVYWKSGDTAVSFSASSQGALTGAWHHVVGQRNGDSFDIYLDGKLIGTGTSSGSHGAMQSEAIDPNIGACNNGARQPFDGKLDDVRVYNYALTAKQVIDAMNAGQHSGSPVSSQAGYWRFDEGYGTSANDQTVNTNTLTLSSASWTNSGKLGKAWNGTGAVWLSRTDDADFDFDSTSPFTITGWVKSDSASNPGATEYVVNKASATVAGWAVYFNTSGNLCFGIDDDTTWDPDVASCTSTDIYDNTWHHFTAVRNTKLDTTAIFIDGVSKDSDNDSTSATLANSQLLYVGDRDGTDNGDEFNGDVDELKIYHYAMTLPEAQKDFNQGKVAVLGSISTESNGTTASFASARGYCVPGDSTTCTGAVADWPLDEKTGQNANDNTGGSATDTLGSSTAIASDDPTWVSGKIGGALDFDGSNDYVDIGTENSISLTGPMTTSAWIKFDTSQTNPIISKSGNSANRGYRFTVQSDNTVDFRIYNTSNTEFSSGASSALSLNTWYYVTGVYNPSTAVQIYVNGKLENQNTTSIPALQQNSTNGMAISRGANAAGFFNGIIDQVRIFNYAFSQPQIAWDFNNGAPQGQYRFDECQGSTANNSTTAASGAAPGNNATITIAASGTQTAVGDCRTSATTAWYSGRNGKINSSLNLDGTDDYAAVGNAYIIAGTNLAVSNFSWGGWFYPTSSAASKTLIHKNNEFRLTTDSSSRPQCEIYSGGSWQTAVASTAALSLSSWSHLLCTYDGANIRLYLNGRQTASGAQTNTVTALNTTALNIGRDSAGSGYFSGQVDEVKVWNYSLTAAQAKTELNEGKAVRFGPSTGTP